MPISFVETMRGTLTDDRGATHPIAFDVAATGEGGGHFVLRGVMSSPPWTNESVAEGTLIISLSPPSITYRLSFDADDGRRLHLDAQKTIRALTLISSMTEMPATLTEGQGHRLGAGRMTFDLRDLPRFLASWLPVANRQQRLLDVRRRALDRAALTGA